jgi:ankyrin repeat protein
MADREKIKLAVKHGNLSTVKTVLSEIGCTGKYDEALIQSCRYGKLDFVIYLLDANLVSKQYLNAAFKRAVSNGHLHIVKYFVEVIKCDDDNAKAMPAKYATMDNQLEILKYLISTGLKPQCYENMLLRSSAYCGHMDIIKYLVEDCKVSDVTESCLICIKNGRLDFVEYFIAHGFDIKKHGNRALEKAIKCGQLDIAKFFVSMGCDNSSNLNIFRGAASANHMDTIKYFVGLGYNAALCLLIAAENDNLELAKYTLELGYDSDIESALAQSLSYAKYGMTKYLVSMVPIVTKNVIPREKWHYSSNTGMEIIMPYFRKRDLFKISNRDYSYMILKYVSKQLVTKKTLLKNNLLKCVLKPKSLAMQMILIE